MYLERRLRILNADPTALFASLAFDAATDHAFTLVDGADRNDLTSIARTIAHRPLNIGTPSLLKEVLRQRLVRRGRSVRANPRMRSVPPAGHGTRPGGECEVVEDLQFAAASP